jgi:hypothetical protein
MIGAVGAVRLALPDIRTIDFLVVLVAGAIFGAAAREVPRLLAAATSGRLRAEFQATSGSVPVDTIIERDGRSYFHMSLDEPGEFRGRFGGNRFGCLMWDAVGTFDSGARAALAARVVAAGCRYVVCGGKYCEAWQVAFHRAIFDLFQERAKPGERYCGYTHGAEEAVARCFVRPPPSETEEESITTFLVLQVGGDWPQHQRLRDAVTDAVSKGRDDLSGILFTV